MEDVAAPVAVETDEHARLLARGQVHGVFPTGVRWRGVPAVTREYLEVDEVQVYGVRSRGRPKVPDLSSPNSGLAAIRSGSNGSPLIPHITSPLSPTRVKRNSRVRLALDSSSPSNSAISESCRGIVLSSFSLRVIRNRMTFAVLPSPMRFLA
jgi:hypothetical protein